MKKVIFEGVVNDVKFDNVEDITMPLLKQLPVGKRSMPALKRKW